MLIAMTSVLILAVWLVVYVPLANRIRTEDRAVMKERLRTIRALLQAEQTHPDRLRSRVEKEWATREFDRTYVRIRNPNGSMLIQSPTPKNAEIFDGFELADIREKRLTRYETDGMILVGAKAEIALYDGDKPYLVEAAFDRSSEADLFKKLREALWGLSVAGIFICLAGAQLFVRIAIKPVRRISEMASLINSESLKTRIVSDRLPAEFKELAQTFNGMMNRLEDSFDRLSRFSADMAHELRTPVHNIMGSFGVALAQPRTSVEYADTLALGIEECDRLKRIIESLLFIARSENPAQEVELQTLNLREELIEILSFYEALADEAGIAIKLEMTSEIAVRAERTLLQRAIGNLMSNAIRFSEPGREVYLLVRAEGARAYITVRDHGCGIDSNLLSKMGERFYRPDPSRSQASGGTGLGLSIVKVIALIHSGTFKIESERNHGTSVEIDFEIASASRPESRI